MNGTDLPSVPPPQESSPEATYLVIPCPPDRFGEFVANLLGKPQVITKNITGSFSITRNDIANFFELIEHRIAEQQQHASLVQFTVKTSYDDASSVEVTSIDTFMEYAEVKPLIPRSVAMTWVYLIKFKNSEVPERQQIDVQLVANNRKYDGGYSGREASFDSDSDVLLPTLLRYQNSYTGAAMIRISNTARSWGIDIEGLLTNHINNLMHYPGSRFRRWTKRNSTLLGAVNSVLSGAFFLTVGYEILARHWQSRMARFQTLLKRSYAPIDLLEAKVDFTVNRLTGRDTLFWLIGGVIYVSVAIVLCIIIGVYSSEKVQSGRPSFLILSSRSSDYRDYVLKRYNNDFLKFCATFAVSVLAGVLSNIGFFFIWS